jgi:hypothetical protein
VKQRDGAIRLSKPFLRQQHLQFQQALPTSLKSLLLQVAGRVEDIMQAAVVVVV